MQLRLIEFENLDSSNSEASRGDYGHGDIILTQWQSQGRGQRGNSWNSNAGENLMFSLVIEPTHIKVYEQFMVSIIGALASSDALRELGLDCKLKWPNDLYVGDKKIGGILIEHCSMGENLSRSIIGIGINVLQQTFPKDLPNPTSLILNGVETSPKALLEIFGQHFIRRYSQNTEQLAQDYLARLWRGDGQYLFRDSKGEFSASIHRIDPLTGELTLQTKDNTLCKYYFKEVEFVL